LGISPAAELGRSWRVRQRGKWSAGMFRSQSGTRVNAEGNFFIWIRCTPLKTPDSTKEQQGNPSFSPWFSLVLLGFIWSELADRLYFCLDGS
jgi:hypothetical protein